VTISREHVPKNGERQARTERGAWRLSLLFSLLLCLLPALPMAGQEKLIVKDALGRTVTVPAKVSRVLSLQPEVSRIVVALGAGDMLVGRDDFIARYDHLFSIIYPPQGRLPVASAVDGAPNLEQVMRLRPDVVFASPSEFNIPDSLQRKTGIPVLALASMGRFEELLEEIRWVGAALGRTERAAQLIECSKKVLDRVRKTVADIPADQRPRVYLSFWSSLTRTPVFYEPVTAAGGRNLAEGLVPAYLGTIGTDVNLEKVRSWNPDIILVQGSFLPAERRVTTYGILHDSRLRSVRAVLNKKVFYTFGFWYWWDPALVLVETLTLGKLFHPQRFQDIDIRREGNAVFKTFYGIEAGFDTLCRKLDIRNWPWR
jgi:iron complex transport system substrate-binding protein